MNSTIMLNFMRKLYESSYGNGSLTAHIKTLDDALDVDAAFKFDHWELSDDKNTITLYGDDDIRVLFDSQKLKNAVMEGDLFIFSTDTMEIAIGFI